MQVFEPTLPPRPSRKWARLSSWSPQPARMLHRGAPLPNHQTWEKAWKPCLAYGADHLITAVARPATGVFIGARDQWAAHEGYTGSKRALKTAEGAAAGFGKGLVGCAVSAGGACVFLSTGVGLGGAALFEKLMPNRRKAAPTAPQAP